ncbi:MAG: tRNA-dihydrouridine synthase [bacterium]|nr:tRNA-dihydrouridine synthase [bacterium]
MSNFWKELPRPFFALAPMEDVTDAAFRRLIASKSDSTVPRVLYTEFTSADGILKAPESGRRKLLKKLEYSEIERPIVAQLFTAVPKHMEKIARMCAAMGFDGFDINMGCPDRSIEKSGCGAALIKNPVLARELIRAAKKGAGVIPVSVKTRIGYSRDTLEEWLPELLAEEPAAVALHARTRKEMSDVSAHWERIKRSVEIRDELKSPTLIIGNGDVRDLADAREKAAETGCDGAMLGRSVFGNPWLFSDRKDAPTPSERIKALLEHLGLFEELMAETTNYAVMKKHFKAYISGWPDASAMRVRLMETEDVEEARVILQELV